CASRRWRSRRCGSSLPSVSRLVLDELEQRESGLAVSVEKGKQRIQDLRLPRLVPFPARWSPLAHHAVDLERQPEALIPVFCVGLTNSDSLGAPRRENPRQVVVDHRRLSFAVQRRRYALVGLLRGQPLHQRQIGRASCRERVEMLVGGGG